MAMRDGGVGGFHAVPIDNQGGRPGIHVFPVHEQVGDNFAENLLAEVDSLGAFQMERIGQVLGDKFHQQIVGINQVDADVQPVVIAVEVFPPDQGIDLVSGNQLLKKLFLSEQ